MSQTSIPSRRRARRISDPHAELQALRSIGQALSSAWDLVTTLHAISETTAQVMRMDSCSIYLLDKSRQALLLKASTGLAPSSVNQARLEIGEGITGYAAQSGKPVAVRRAAEDTRFKYLPETQEHKYKSLLAVPLVSQGTIIGAMNVQTRAYHDFGAPEIELLSLIGDLSAGALERAVLHDDMERQIRELSTLAQVSRTFTAPLYLNQMLAVVVEMAAQIMHARACALFLFDQERGELVLRASHGASPEHILGWSPPVQASQSGEAIVIADLGADPSSRNRHLASEAALLALLSVPLKVRSRVIGTLNCYLDTVHLFRESEIELFSTLANQTALAIDNANLAMNAMLVREMHHRIKNNLQTVAMLLRLQLRNPDLSAAEVLHQTINRILSIAAVHEALSQEGSRSIGLKGLIQQAALVATQNMVQPGRDIRVTIEGQDLRLLSQPATSIALAANELIQNALEHAFGEQGRGNVIVRLGRAGEDLELQVTDNGVGLRESYESGASLGLQIVQTLVTEDLQGQFTIAPGAGGRGTSALIRIPGRILYSGEEGDASNPGG